MRSWAEAVLAVALTGILGLGFYLFSGQPLGGETTETTAPVTVDGESAARGEILAADSGCIACHTVDGTPSTGPTWKGVAGSSRPLDSGESVVADDLYLIKSIIDPGAQIVAGFDNVMVATYGDTLSDQEISDLVEYIKSQG